MTSLSKAILDAMDASVHKAVDANIEALADRYTAKPEEIFLLFAPSIFDTYKPVRPHNLDDADLLSQLNFLLRRELRDRPNPARVLDLRGAILAVKRRSQ